MMDQLVDVGVEFDAGTLRRMLIDTESYYREHPMAAVMPTKEAPEPKGKAPKAFESIKSRVPDGLTEKASKVIPTTYYKWATDDILVNNHPVRPWACGAILRAHSPMYTLTGSITRSPGMYHKLNVYDGKELPEYLEGTNEKIHPSARIRLATGGLGYDDKKKWNASALTDAGWELKKRIDGKWIWAYEGKEDLPNRVLEESEMGHYEKRMLELAGGVPNILSYVDNMRVEDVQTAGSRKASMVKKIGGSEVIVRNTP